MDVISYYKSLTKELEGQRDRVREIIGSAHWPSDGEWKESILTSALSARTPQSVRIGRGFVISRAGVSQQCDLILYKASSPLLFNSGDFVVVPADGVLAVIEIKTRLDSRNLKKAIVKLAAIGNLLDSRIHLGLFSFEAKPEISQRTLSVLQAECTNWKTIVGLVSLGCSTFVKWWDCYPPGTPGVLPGTLRQCWHAYELQDMAAGYFLSYIIELACSNQLWTDRTLWFPDLNMESYKVGEIAFRDSMSPPSADG